MKEIIRKLLPVSEQLTPLLREDRRDGKYYYFDATRFGWTVFYALRDDEELGSNTQMYVIDGCECTGELEEATNVMLVPTMHCQKCGRRMFAGTFPKEPEHVLYRCICGEQLDGDVIENIMRPDEDE